MNNNKGYDLEIKNYCRETGGIKFPEEDWYDMGIVIEAKHRGKGYAAEAVQLLLAHAFESLKSKAVHNAFEENRAAAVKTHLSAGFQVCKKENGIIEFLRKNSMKPYKQSYYME